MTSTPLHLPTFCHILFHTISAPFFTLIHPLFTLSPPLFTLSPPLFKLTPPLFHLISAAHHPTPPYTHTPPAILTAAMQMLGGSNVGKQCRSPAIMADAAYYVITRPSQEFTGNFCIDERLLRNAGVKDFEHYAYDPGELTSGVNQTLDHGSKVSQLYPGSTLSLLSNKFIWDLKHGHYLFLLFIL